MTPTQLAFVSHDLAILLEQQALAGAWKWNFADGLQEWSLGLRRLLGLAEIDIAPDYDLILKLAHSEDRKRLPSAAAVMQGQQVSNTIFRIIRPDGIERILSTTISIYFSPDGRPLAASALIIDITDRDRLDKLRVAEQRTQAALYRICHVTTFSLRPDLLHDLPSEVAEVHGIPIQEINADPFLMVVPGERSALREKAWCSHIEQTIFQDLAFEELANGNTIQFRIIGVPLWDHDGNWLGRTGLKYPYRASSSPSVTGDLLQALERSIDNQHLRSARALLGWSMTELAQASGLSLSTVRRTEGDGIPPKDASRHKIIRTLRQAGIRFISMDDGTIAIAKR